jgi:hypothetical protein
MMPLAVVTGGVIKHDKKSVIIYPNYLVLCLPATAG